MTANSKEEEVDGKRERDRQRKKKEREKRNRKRKGKGKKSREGQDLGGEGRMKRKEQRRQVRGTYPQLACSMAVVEVPSVPSGP
jgi:hypothetical protein